MQPVEPLVALKRLEETPDWVCFKQKALDMESLVDLHIISGTSVKELDDIPSHFLDVKLEV